MSLSDIEECPLGRALRAIREADSRPRTDWSSTPIGQFYEAISQQLAKRRARFIEPRQRRQERMVANRRRRQRAHEARP